MDLCRSEPSFLILWELCWSLPERASFHPSYFIPCHLSVTYGGAPRWFPCIYIWLMTCQHHCQVQCHSALPVTKECYHLATDNRTEGKREAASDSCLIQWFLHCFFIVVNFPFEVSNDHLPSRHYHHHTCQPFCSLRCSEWANTKHLFTLFLSPDQRRLWLQTSSADDTGCQMFPPHQMASPAIHIAF